MVACICERYFLPIVYSDAPEKGFGQAFGEKLSQMTKEQWE
jgi:hypothetical protein